MSPSTFTARERATGAAKRARAAVTLWRMDCMARGEAGAEKLAPLASSRLGSRETS